MSTQNSLYLWLGQHVLACFVLLTFSFIVFGALSLDLIRLFSANAAFLLAHGWIAVLEGGLRQFLELLFNAFLAMAAYLLFKLSEHALVHRLMAGRGATRR
ncbi:hypothetical protein WG899_18620 [Paucibacter sp. AS339]|uniref:hypothetical protein n=1 Tax=Paucibacter hankyongi TaxID=3133434 RepID=UPI00309B2D15